MEHWPEDDPTLPPPSIATEMIANLICAVIVVIVIAGCFGLLPA